MARKRKSGDDDQNAIDLTPMLDVVFIMLIFFIVTASFIKEAGIEINRPDATTAELKKSANILVAVSANNEVWIDKNQVDIRAVKGVIERMHAENPKGALVIQADDESNIETLTKVAEAAREAGVLDVSVSTEKK
ncbi:MAG: biopolymer transporter ExbD [Gammaproteobacteria bacterium]|uniref:ExbD/TolR family protein n=1 Tax=Pseudomaricurvus alcaniphilus TaxID=1166482 RepID=UPI00140E4A8C|nr:biopolymer transporter ExbD [Pseudomaricurvus alcaniphilus]MBR9909484.1 biopolymer transporter ExbD [Gammaproteobacteria bacterium]NHN37111.1 biopolymer transporter ExbD [Pseudomaricurvus alcaniphilus]